jgi:hypothetical protein
MNTPIRVLLLGLGAALVSVPIGIILTLVLTPFWSWLEATTGIESVGHSGPSDWCYWVIVCSVFSAIAALLFARERRRRHTPSR